jgi:hypothetical protein
MKRMIFLLVTIGCLTGCSELRIIGTAAMKELRTDGVNAEMAALQVPDPIVEPAKVGAPVVVVAKAVVPPPQPRNYKKGAWEHF